MTHFASGQRLPACDLPALTRTMLALYAGGSGDHNPLHIDSDFARDKAKMDDVIGQGMLSMALLGRYLSEIVPQRAIRTFDARFLDMTKVGDRLVCVALVERVWRDGDIGLAELSLTANRQNGDAILSGTAVVETE